MSQPVAFNPSQSPDPSNETDRRSEKIADAVRALLDTLPLSEQEEILQELTKKLRVIPASRAGDVLGTVVRLLPLRKSWTLQEIRQQIEERGIEARQKDIYNAVGYLTKKRKIRRVGPGRYVVEGVEIVTADELGGPQLYPASEHGD